MNHHDDGITNSKIKLKSKTVFVLLEGLQRVEASTVSINEIYRLAHIESLYIIVCIKIFSSADAVYNVNTADKKCRALT